MLSPFVPACFNVVSVKKQQDILKFVFGQKDKTAFISDGEVFISLNSGCGEVRIFKQNLKKNDVEKSFDEICAFARIKRKPVLLRVQKETEFKKMVCGNMDPVDISYTMKIALDKFLSQR